MTQSALRAAGISALPTAEPANNPVAQQGTNALWPRRRKREKPLEPDEIQAELDQMDENQMRFLALNFLNRTKPQGHATPKADATWPMRIPKGAGKRFAQAKAKKAEDWMISKIKQAEEKRFWEEADKRLRNR